MARSTEDVRSDDSRDNLRNALRSIVDYHNALAQNRFTIAGLYLAATGFLVNSWFGGATEQALHSLIPVLGLVFTFICWLLEIRTYQLLANLGQQGKSIEDTLEISPKMSFFHLMAEQPVPAKLPFFGPNLPPIVSHSISLDFLYLANTLFWLCILGLAGAWAGFPAR